MEKKNIFVKAVVLSSTLTLTAIVFLTIFAELNPSVKNWLAGNFSHHWIGKSAISILVFLVFIPVFYVLKLEKISTVSLIWLLVVVANLSFGILLAFFFFETYF